MSSEVVHPPLLLQLHWETPKFLNTTNERLRCIEGFSAALKAHSFWSRLRDRRG